MTKFMDELMAEKINYGGFALSRSAVYDHALAAVSTRAPDDASAQRVADRYAFGSNAKALTCEEADRLLPESVFASTV